MQFVLNPSQLIKLSIELIATDTATYTTYGAWTGYKLIQSPSTVASTVFVPASQTGATSLESYTSVQSGIKANPLTFVFASPVFEIQVTGLAATNIDWTIIVKQQLVS